MRRSDAPGRLALAIGASASLVALSAAPALANPHPAHPADSGWRLVYGESFGAPLAVDSAPWVKDPHGDASPWNVDHLDDDGKYYEIQGGSEFRRQLAGSDILRKRVSFGKDGWLTAELAARDLDKDGRPEGAPSLRNVTTKPGGRAARLEEPRHDGGAIIRSTRALPQRYRIEYTLRTIDFGGKRNGTWEYDGKTNGYGTEGCKTNWPWKARGDFSGPADPCNPNFGDVRGDNGFYFLAIMDYARPAPHNNVFIHNHRKVGMDAYNVKRSGVSGYAICNPATKQPYNYNAPESSGNGINEIFFDGSRWRDASIGYNQFIMPTECGTFDGTESTPGSIVSATEIQPELMPRETYRFAIERDATGYTTEMSGNFRNAGRMTLRYHRDFVQGSTPIWHYNNTPGEYDGRFNSTLTFSGPHGSYSVQQWPKGSAYPDYFILGDPHLNFYEGSATVDDIRLYVPREK